MTYSGKTLCTRLPHSLRARSYILPAFILVASLLGAITPYGAFSNESNDNSQQTTTVMFGDVAYRVPNTYLLGFTPFKAKSPEALVGSGYASFTIGLLLPDFQTAKSNWTEFQRSGWHNQLRASFEYGRQYRERSAVIAQLLSWGKIKLGDYVKLDNGCRVYHGNMAVTQELRVCDSPFGTLMIECKTNEKFPFPTFPYCHISENLSNDATLAYAYSRNFVQDAVEIDNHLHSLFHSFSSTSRNANP